MFFLIIPAWGTASWTWTNCSSQASPQSLCSARSGSWNPSACATARGGVAWKRCWIWSGSRWAVQVINVIDVLAYIAIKCNIYILYIYTLWTFMKHNKTHNYIYIYAISCQAKLLNCHNQMISIGILAEPWPWAWNLRIDRFTTAELFEWQRFQPSTLLVMEQSFF